MTAADERQSPLGEREHNVVSILYSLKGMIESHLELAREGNEQQKENVMRHAEEVLRRAYSQADQALQITKRLGRIMEPKQAMPLKTFHASLNEAWEEVLRTIRREFSLEEVEILSRIPENFPALQCEKGDFEEILYNLARNAIQAMGGSGKLVIRAQLAFSVKEEAFAAVSLTDTGRGIPGEKLPHLFDPFYTTQDENEGNGLGLYLVKALVARNGGRISVSSFEGCGATFTLEFPLAGHLK